MKPKNFREGPIRVSFSEWTDEIRNRVPLDFAMELSLRYYCNHGPQRNWLSFRVSTETEHSLLWGKFPLCCREYRRSDWARAAFFLWLDGKLGELIGTCRESVLPCRRRVLESWAEAIGAPSDQGVSEVLADLRAIQTSKEVSGAALAAELARVRGFVESVRTSPQSNRQQGPSRRYSEPKLVSALQVFGFDQIEEVTVVELKARFRAKSLESHPDRNGSVNDFQRLQGAFAVLMKMITN